MNKSFIFIILIQSVLSLILFISIAWIVNKILINRLSKDYNMENQNTSFILYLCGVMLASSIILSSASGSFINTMKILSIQSTQASLITQSAAFLFYIVFATLILILIFHWLTAYLHYLLFQNSIYNAIADGQIQAAIFAIATFIALSYLFSDIVVRIMEAITPYPSVPNLF